MEFCPLIDPRFKLGTNVEVANSIVVGLSSQDQEHQLRSR